VGNQSLQIAKNKGEMIELVGKRRKIFSWFTEIVGETERAERTLKEKEQRPLMTNALRSCILFVHPRKKENLPVDKGALFC